MASINLAEKANFTRLGKLLVDKGTEALRNILDTMHPPANLPAVLNSNKAALLRLKPRVIDNTQWDLLFPPSGNPPDSKKFDITLLTVLLRNICSLTSPATGWNTMPPNTDRSPQANITRIKLFRNEVYAHVASTQLSKATFENLWQNISEALGDLNIQQKEINDLKTCSLGPEEERYKEIVKEWVLKEEDCKNMLADLSTDVKLIEQRLVQSDLQQEDDREVLRSSMQHLTSITAESLEEIQQLRLLNTEQHGNERPKCHPEENRVGESNITSDEVRKLQGLAKHNFRSKIRSKVKSFHSGTRDWLIKKLEDWFTTEDESGLLLISAGPGFGKSVFAAKACELFKEKGKLAACHFCDFSDSNLKDPMMMIQSLASHMCENVVGFRKELLDQLKRPHKVRNLKDAFQIYLQNPLDELQSEPVLIVIDGLDESATDDKSDMVKLIADHFPDLPKCVKILLTSRPELPIQRLEHIQMIELDAEDKDNELDILKYLKVYLPRLASKDSMFQQTQRFHNKGLSAIVEKCEGSFLYAFHVQHELCKRDDLDTMTFKEVMSFLPIGMGSVYHAYFHRLEIELKAVMKRNPELFKFLELLVAIDSIGEPLPLKFVARALGLNLDCRETKKVLNKVNEVISSLLYISEDLITVFHKSVYDWLLASGYEEHEYTVKVSDGKKRLWLVCEQVFEEIRRTITLGHDLKLTNDVTHALEYGHEYLLACNLKDSFPWFVDMIILHVLSTVHPKSTRHLQNVFREVLQGDVAMSLQLRQRISWHLIEIISLQNNDVSRCSEFMSKKAYFYLENVIDHSPDGCFTEIERKTAEGILEKLPRCVKRNLHWTNSLKPILTKVFPFPIVAIGVSSNTKLAAAALSDGTVCLLSLPELVEISHYSTKYESISCCTFSPDGTFVLYGKLEMAINIAEQTQVSFFSEQVENFKSCAFSPRGQRLITSDGSNTIKLWDVAKQSLLSVLCAGVPVDCCSFSNTGLFIKGNDMYMYKKEDPYCVWNSITLQRVDQRTSFSASKLGKKNGGVLWSEKCMRCIRQECRELIPLKGLICLASMQLNRNFSHSIASVIGQKKSKVTSGSYNEVDSVFYLRKQQSLRVLESTHFTTLAAWDIFIEKNTIQMEVASFIDIKAIGDNCWLYGDDGKLVVFSSVPPKGSQSGLARPTLVLWCSFSPDGTRLATCTADGFVNLWNVGSSRVYQRVKTFAETSAAACLWSEEYLFVCHVIEKIPSLVRFAVDENLKIDVAQMKPTPLYPVVDEFLPFSGFLDFSEGYLSFECGRTKPVKVIDVKELAHPKVVILPGIKPMMSIAVSAGAWFVLGAGGGYFLWKKSEARPSMYEVMVSFGGLRLERGLFAAIGTRLMYECCFSSDSKLAVVSSVQFVQRDFLVIDVDTGIMVVDDMVRGEGPQSSHLIPKVFCTETAIILLTPNLIEFFCLENWKRFGLSFQRHLTGDLLITSKLSPKGTILAIPRLTGEMEFLRLCIPETSSLSNELKSWERLGGMKFLIMQ